MYFEQNKIVVEEVLDARKEKMDNDKAWDLIQTREVLYVGKGKKVLDFKPDEAVKAGILKVAMGRSGNLRAPTVRTAQAIFIGYNDQIYQNL